MLACAMHWFLSIGGFMLAAGEANHNTVPVIQMPKKSNIITTVNILM
jgi:hypothetical protein